MFLDESLVSIPYVVVDLETTGLNPLVDEVIEIGAVAVTPGQRPRLVLDTLVKPQGPIRASHVHGITDEHVEGAPAPEDLLEILHAVFANRVLVAHNAAFERSFLVRGPLRGLIRREVPYLCTMGLHRAVHGVHRSLGAACLDLNLPIRDRHTAADDALMTADLLCRLLKNGPKAGFRRGADLEGVAGCSLAAAPLPVPSGVFTAPPDLQQSRSPTRRRGRTAERDYLDLVLTVVSDLEISDEELRHVKAAQHNIAPPSIRAIHAKVFERLLARYTEDRNLDDHEAKNLAELWRCLEKLGWAPGSPVDMSAGSQG